MIDFGLEHYFLEGDPMNTHSKSSMEDFHPVLVIPVCNRIASLIKILLKLVTQKYYSLFDVYISLGCSVSIKDVYVHVVYIFVQKINRELREASIENIHFLDYYKTSEFNKLSNLSSLSKIEYHFAYILDTLSDKDQYSHILILEDDLYPSNDFLNYFVSTYSLLDSDPSLYCISAWNDNAYVLRFSLLFLIDLAISMIILLIIQEQPEQTTFQVQDG